jgi:hypothetical protein
MVTCKHGWLQDQACKCGLLHWRCVKCGAIKAGHNCAYSLRGC